MGDNGGEINFTQEIDDVFDSLPYTSNFFDVGNKTLAYRLKQTLDGKKVDYNLNLDKE